MSNKPPTLSEEIEKLLYPVSATFLTDAILTAFEKAMPEKDLTEKSASMKDAYRIGYNQAIDDTKAILHKEKKG